MLDAATSAVGIQYYYLIREMMGVDYMRELGAQNLRFLSPNNAIAEQVVSGELFGAPALTLNVAEEFKAKKAPIDWRFPTPATPILVRTVQIAAKAAHPNAAKLFVNFLLAKDGQEGFQKVARSLSPRTDVRVAGIPRAGTFPAARIIDIDAFASSKKELQDEFIRFFKTR